MKIICLIDSLGSGGAQRQITTLAKLWKKAGYNVEFLIYHDDNFFQSTLISEAISIHKIEAKSILSRIIAIRKFLRNSGQDIVVSFLDMPNFFACISKMGGAKWKLIISERSCKLTNFTSVKLKIMKSFFRYADAIISNSQRAMNLWETYYPQYHNKFHVIYNTVDFSQPKSEYIIRRNGRINIVVAASYQYLKNMQGVIEGLNLLTDEEQSKIYIEWFGAAIHMVNGRANAYDHAVELIKQYQLTEVISLNNVIKNINEKMYQADAIGLFSSVEGLPNAICEGMMLGKPIIMSRVSDFNILINESNGFLCDWDNPETIRDAFRSIINKTNDELLEMGMASKKNADFLFNKTIITNQWIQLFEDVNHIK